MNQPRNVDLHVQLSDRPRLADLPEGRFGRLFPDLPCLSVDGNTLLRYGAANGPLECTQRFPKQRETETLESLQVGLSSDSSWLTTSRTTARHCRKPRTSARCKTIASRGSILNAFMAQALWDNLIYTTSVTQTSS